VEWLETARIQTEQKHLCGGGIVANGLYANINAKRQRIKAGSGEKMAKVGSPGAPTATDFKVSAKTAKPVKNHAGT
jgi:hypothetical protein